MPSFRVAAAAVAGLIVLGGCAAHRPDLSVSGSDVQYQPKVESAGQDANASFRITVRAPRAEYLTSVVVFTGASAQVITANPDTATTAMAVGEGTHQFLLAYARHQAAPVSFARRTFPGRDGTLSDETGRPVEPYAVVVATASPLALTRVQATLDTVDLRGPASEVLSRVSQAVASLAAGPWGAASHRLNYEHNGI
jgi:hypothetical protein